MNITLIIALLSLFSATAKATPETTATTDTPATATNLPIADLLKAIEEPAFTTIDFDHPSVLRFLEHHCQPESIADALFTDRELCNSLRNKKLDELKGLIICNICFEPIKARTLGTVGCGHVSHKLCRFRTRKEQCHVCRTEGPRPHNSLEYSTLLRKAMELFESNGWLTPPTVEELHAQDTYRGDEVVPTGPRGRTIPWEMSDWETDGGYALNIPSSGPYIDMPPDASELIRAVYVSAKEAMETCMAVRDYMMPEGRQTGLRLSRRALELPQEPLIPLRFRNIPSVATIPYPGFRNAIVVVKNERLRAIFNQTMTLLMVTLEDYPSTPMELRAKRIINLKRLVHRFPCDSVVPKPLITGKFDTLVSSFVHRWIVEDYTAETVGFVESDIRDAVASLPRLPTDRRALRHALRRPGNQVRSFMKDAAEVFRKIVDIEMASIRREIAVRPDQNMYWTAKGQIAALLPMLGLPPDERAALVPRTDEVLPGHQEVWLTRLGESVDRLVRTCDEAFAEPTRTFDRPPFGDDAPPAARDPIAWRQRVFGVEMTVRLLHRNRTVEIRRLVERLEVTARHARKSLRTLVDFRSYANVPMDSPDAAPDHVDDLPDNND